MSDEALHLEGEVSPVEQRVRLNNCSLRSAWGTRNVDSISGSGLLRSTFALLDQIGGDLTSPWHHWVGTTETSGYFEDVSGMSDNDLQQFLNRSIDTEHPEIGFIGSLYCGVRATSALSWVTVNGASIKFGLGAQGGETFGDHFALDGDWYSLGASNTLRKHAISAVKGLSRIWRPEYMSFQDRDLRSFITKFWQDHNSGMRRWPAWGYVSFLSDQVSRNLEQNVVGASVVKFGTGWILTTDSQEPEEAAAVWQRLHERQCLRYLPANQGVEPRFPRGAD